MTDACGAAGAFAHKQWLTVTFSSQTSILWLNLSRGWRARWTGAEGGFRQSSAGLAGAGEMAGALQSAWAAAAKHAAPAQARGECVFAIISIITTS